MQFKRIALWTVTGLAVAVVVLVVVIIIAMNNLPDTFEARYQENCSACHGENLDGTGIGPALVGRELTHGESVPEIVHSITNGFPEKGMPRWGESIDDGVVQSMAIYITEQRANRPFLDFKTAKPLEIPTGVQTSEEHDFKLEVVATGIHSLPFAIAPLPDGSILVTEKTQGIRVVSPDGELSELLTGTPAVSDLAIPAGELEYGLGWLMDIAIHPDYESNGWVYLHHGDICEECDSLINKTMNRVVRGRIVDGAWVDEEVIWSVPKELYTSTPDMAAGGRLAFDDEGFLYISVGMKGPSNYQGIQNLSLPYGKIHRVHDDGSMPTDNPFPPYTGAWPSTWTYGHRSPQGLEVDPQTGLLWGTEMGPRGGDEVNLLTPGKNFGWPLYSKGLNYDGTPVEYGKLLGIEFDLEDIEQPKVDLTPSPAVSSFIFYTGDAFPRWRNQMLIGSLKATQLYRMVVEGEEIVHRETLLDNFVRIRDIENGPDGNIYMLLEHTSGGQIVRMVPVDPPMRSKNTDDSE